MFNSPIHITDSQITQIVRLRVRNDSGECLLCVVGAQVGADGRAVVRRGVMGERNVIRSVRVWQDIWQTDRDLEHVLEIYLP